MKNWRYWGVVVGILAIFLFLRLWAIRDGFFFFNDMGRDMLVLQQWRDSGKPPLLGPQNSSLPFNQPGLYFYWLMPLFLLFSGSPFSSIFTLVLTMSAFFLAGAYLLRKKPEWPSVFLGFSWLVALHPTHIQQNRFVWNPSFVTPFFATAVIALVWLREKWTVRRVQLFAFCLAAAVSFSYSVAPAAVAVVLLILWWWRTEVKKIFFLGASLAAWTLFFQIPTLVFELRYNFQLTKAVLNSPETTHEGLEWSVKLQQLLSTSTGLAGVGQTLLIGAFLSCVVLNLVWLKRSASFSVREKAFFSFLPLFVTTLVLTLVAPVPLHAHYIFAIVTLAFLVVATLHKRLAIGFIVLASLAWLHPTVLQKHFIPARRSFEVLMACMRQVCEAENEPLFVSVQSSYHPYHNGPEFRFALGESGCKVKSIELEPQAAQRMTVVEDGGLYEHGKTDFYELALFGPSKVAENYNCTDDLSVVILEKQR